MPPDMTEPCSVTHTPVNTSIMTGMRHDKRDNRIHVSQLL